MSSQWTTPYLTTLSAILCLTLVLLLRYFLALFKKCRNKPYPGDERYDLGHSLLVNNDNDGFNELRRLEEVQVQPNAIKKLFVSGAVCVRYVSKVFHEDDGRPLPTEYQQEFENLRAYKSVYFGSFVVLYGLYLAYHIWVLYLANPPTIQNLTLRLSLFFFMVVLFWSFQMPLVELGKREPMRCDTDIKFNTTATKILSTNFRFVGAAIPIVYLCFADIKFSGPDQNVGQLLGSAAGYYSITSKVSNYFVDQLYTFHYNYEEDLRKRELLVEP